MANITTGPCKKCKTPNIKYEFMFFCKKCYEKELADIKRKNIPWTPKTEKDLEL